MNFLFRILKTWNTNLRPRKPHQSKIPHIPVLAWSIFFKLITFCKIQYSYFRNGCQLQCVLLLTCRHVISRTIGISPSLLLAEHQSNVDTIYPSPDFQRPPENPPNKKDGDPHWHITGTCRHVMGKHCWTDYIMKIAVTFELVNFYFRTQDPFFEREQLSQGTLSQILMHKTFRASVCRMSTGYWHTFVTRTSWELFWEFINVILMF